MDSFCLVSAANFNGDQEGIHFIKNASDVILHCMLIFVVGV